MISCHSVLLGLFQPPCVPIHLRVSFRRSLAANQSSRELPPPEKAGAIIMWRPGVDPGYTLSKYKYRYHRLYQQILCSVGHSDVYPTEAPGTRYDSF